jgi:hypothetical protein
MKLFLITTIMIIIFCQSAFGQKVDSTCFKIISSRLEVIKNYLENPNSDTLLKKELVLFLFFQH